MDWCIYTIYIDQHFRNLAPPPDLHCRLSRIRPSYQLCWKFCCQISECPLFYHKTLVWVCKHLKASVLDPSTLTWISMHTAGMAGRSRNNFVSKASSLLKLAHQCVRQMHPIAIETVNTQSALHTPAKGMQ